MRLVNGGSMTTGAEAAVEVAEAGVGQGKVAASNQAYPRVGDSCGCKVVSRADRLWRTADSSWSVDSYAGRWRRGCAETSGSPPKRCGESGVILERHKLTLHPETTQVSTLGWAQGFDPGLPCAGGIEEIPRQTYLRVASRWRGTGAESIKATPRAHGCRNDRSRS